MFAPSVSLIRSLLGRKGPKKSLAAPVVEQPCPHFDIVGLKCRFYASADARTAHRSEAGGRLPMKVES
jgi:hypothetical protein